MVKKLGEYFKVLLLLYFMVGVFFFNQFHEEFNRKNGFVARVFLSYIVPTLKACAWPYYAYYEDRESPEDLKLKSVIYNKIGQVLYFAVLSEEKLSSDQQKELFADHGEIRFWFKKLGDEKRKAVLDDARKLKDFFVESFYVMEQAAFRKEMEFKISSDSGLSKKKGYATFFL